MNNWDRNREQLETKLPTWRTARRRDALIRGFQGWASLSIVSAALGIQFGPYITFTAWGITTAITVICLVMLRITINGVLQAPETALDEYESSLIQQARAKTSTYYQVAFAVFALVLFAFGAFAAQMNTEAITNALIHLGLAAITVSITISGTITIAVSQRLGEPWTNALPATVSESEEPFKQAKVWATQVLAKHELDPQEQQLGAIRAIRMEAPKLSLKDATNLVRSITPNKAGSGAFGE